MTTQEKIAFWQTEAKSSFNTAKDLVKTKHYLEALFFGHLTLEKFLKAEVIKATHREPVYSHDLLILAKYAKLTLTKDERDFLARINVYNIRTRYQDYKRALYQKATQQYTEVELKQIFEYVDKLSN